MVTLTFFPSCKPKWSRDKFNIQSQILEGLGATSWSMMLNRPLVSLGQSSCLWCGWFAYWTRSVCKSMSLFMFCWFQESFRHDICDELWRIIQQLGVPLYLQKDVKVTYSTTYAEVQLNGDTHGEEMSNIVAKQGCPLSPTLFNLYDDELETYLDEINGNSLCSFDIVIVILLMLMMLFSSLS